MKNTTLCYIRNEKNEYLMLYRNKKENDLNEGKWVGVGGKFEAGENAEQCLLREVYEETGIELTSYHFHGIVNFISDVWDDEAMYLFTGTEFSFGGKKVSSIPEEVLNEICNEGELHWIPEKDIMSLNMWEGDRYFMLPLIEHKDKIEMTLEYKGEELVKVY